MFQHNTQHTTGATARFRVSFCCLVSLTFGLVLAAPTAAAPTAAASTVAAPTVAAPTAALQVGDVPEGRYYSDAVKWGISEGILDDLGNSFFPNVPMRRGLTALWFWKMEGEPAASAHSFQDITDSRHDRAISWMVYRGITNGTSPSTYAPNQILTRGQIAAFLHRLAGEPTPSVAHSFTDVQSDWQQDPVSWLATSGITEGTSEVTFAPDEELTRAHLITFLWRYKGKPKASEGLTTVPADQQLVINVPVTSAKGRCADRINTGIYDWEECAWDWEGVSNPELSRPEAQRLTDSVWSEVVTPGKPVKPPVLEEGFCAEGALACYMRESHKIQPQKNFTLRTFLHELAHALIADHPSTTACFEEWQRDQQQCYHGDLYRCVADGLFVRFGGTETAGVCGTGVDSGLGAWVFREMRETLVDRTQQFLTLSTTDWSYPNAPEFRENAANLLVMCYRNNWDVGLSWPGRKVDGPDQANLRVSYRVDDNALLEVYGIESTTQNAVFIVEPEPFIINLLDSSELVVRALNADGKEIGSATYNISHLANRIDELTNCKLAR